MLVIHHCQPVCVCGLSAKCVCVHMHGAHAYGKSEYCWRAVALLAGWVLIGTPSEWYECWCHTENSTDRPTLVHSYGELLSPMGLQIIKAFTILNTRGSHPLTETVSVFVCARVCVSRMSVFRYLRLNVCFSPLSICQMYFHSLSEMTSILFKQWCIVILT